MIARLLRRLADELPPYFVTPAERQHLLSLAREVERAARAEDETRETLVAGPGASQGSGRPPGGPKGQDEP